MWKTIGQHIASYRTYPRLVGETGGKDFVFAHASADVDALATALVRGAFEFQGQKCSAASRAYIPASLWPKLKAALLAQLAEVKVGDPEDFTNFMGAVIDQRAFDNIRPTSTSPRPPEAEILAGGGCDDRTGYFIQPTVVLTGDPKFKLMHEEIFGPVLTMYVYPDAELDKALELCDTGSPYGLTGAVFARDRQAILEMPSGCATRRATSTSTTSPPAPSWASSRSAARARRGRTTRPASLWNLIRWVSPRTIKELFVPPTHFAYPFLGEK